MRCLNEILLPVDFSPRGAEIARYAGAYACHFHSKITLLHVIPPLDAAWATMGNSALLDEVMQHNRAELHNRLDLFLTDELEPFRVERVLADGYPADVITCMAQTRDVGMIMMPTRGGGKFRRFVLGSVAMKVLDDARCPIWTSSHVTDGHPSASSSPKAIVCAADLNPESEAVIEWASEFAAEFQARLIIAHAIPSLEFHPETYFLEADMRGALLSEAQTKLTKLVNGSQTPGAEIRVEGGDVSRVVRSVIEDYQADLLIIGRPSRSGVLGRLRTHSYALIRESPCPVISI